MRLDAYLRVSRVGGREGPRFISPAVQRKRIATWAKASGHEIADWHEDLDQPGSRVERPGLTRAMERVEAGQVRGIVVARLDRFGRSVVHLAGLIERLKAADASLFTVTEGIDTRGPTGKLIADILGAIAEWELGRIRDNWSAARASALARGAYLAEAPFGYRKREDGSLEVDREYSRYTVEAFQRRTTGESWARIADWLNTSGIRARRGGGWTVSAVRRMVANRAYLGEVTEGGEVHRRAHEALVTPSMFEGANAARGVAPSRSGRASGLLSGLLRCSGCRYAMKLSVSRTRHGKPFTEYRCKSARRENVGRCGAPAAVKSSVIEPFVLDAFWAFVGDYQAAGFDPDVVADEAEAAVVDAEAELDAALDRRLVDALGGDESTAYLDVVRQRREALDLARTELAATRQHARAVALPDVNLRELWPDLSLYEQRKLLASVFDCVFVRRTPSGGGAADVAARTWICMFGEAPGLPVRGRRWTAQPFDFPGAAEALS